MNYVANEYFTGPGETPAFGDPYPFGSTRDITIKMINDATVLSAMNLSASEGVDPGEDQRFPSVDSDGTGFVVAYQETKNGNIYDWDTYAASVGGAVSRRLVGRP